MTLHHLLDYLMQLSVDVSLLLLVMNWSFLLKESLIIGRYMRIFKLLLFPFLGASPGSLKVRIFIR